MLPHPVVGTPSPTPAEGSGFYILDGDGSQLNPAPDAHSGFVVTVLRYDNASAEWLTADQPLAPRVTVRRGEGSVITSGEVRAPAVWLFKLGKKE
ncbi:hypothetical protein R5W24_004503 [Gemmata sp. JC717]|uniref:hypothetical protein n=1 Tax=Gemmata algarum TaxID=2975278 RepID=UPI0021BB260F|nr:hypothetical protein [Gemmata algarum]MDY3555360.1 hypothetical protein [Gemmata algarum]